MCSPWIMQEEKGEQQQRPRGPEHGRISSGKRPGSSLPLRDRELSCLGPSQEKPPRSAPPCSALLCRGLQGPGTTTRPIKLVAMVPLLCGTRCLLAIPSTPVTQGWEGRRGEHQAKVELWRLEKRS